MKLHEKYLKTERIDEASKKEAMDKVIKVIRSVKTIGQMNVARKMVGNFIKMYGDTFWAELTSKAKHFPSLSPLWQKFEDEMNTKEKRIKFLKTVKVMGHAE